MGRDYMFSAGAPLSRRTLTWALVAVLLHLPAFGALLIAGRLEAPAMGVYFAAFGVSVMVGIGGIIPFLRDTDAALPPPSRDHWRKLFFYLPQSAAVYWWRYVRKR